MDDVTWINMGESVWRKGGRKGEGVDTENSYRKTNQKLDNVKNSPHLTVLRRVLDRYRLKDRRR
jgi:hypothetical protein